MKIVTLLMLFVVLASVLFISGCTTSNNPVKSQADVTETVQDITTNIDDLDTTLDDIDQGLG